ncbi:hypothetical protein TRFO_13332 [Tritrichomonas foetus]|uniref:Uncharacterized protein n=1 Tax=Tritrichomonas foetus TaxID=1144522 RepID=A0A1J4KY54_9EUKA|nr:hypothetical protein TRFO_13332 [Tritrichomonas foetus]|eukprot:OHT16185.1 hypothetical protein TRFO_13332 [Tritrichomonas foetus]
MREIQETFDLIQKAQQKESSQRQIISTLLHIQNKVNKSNFGTQDSSNDSFLQAIWNFFMFSASFPSLSVQLASERAAIIFLCRIYPFFPFQIENIIASEVKNGPDGRQAAILVSSFAFVAQRLPSMRRSEFFHFCEPIQSIIASKTPLISSIASNIIEKLTVASPKWHRDLLRKFLKNGVETFQMRAVASIIKNVPALSKEAFRSGNLAMMAFILAGNPKLKISKSFDISAVLEEASSLQCSGSSLDDCLTILSRAHRIKTKFLIKNQEKSQTNKEINKEMNEENFVEFSMKNIRKKIPLLRLVDRPAFYLFDGIPLDILLPKKSDGVLILTAKFKKLSLLANQKYSNKIFPIFRDFLLTSPEELASPCMQALSECINSFSGHPDFPEFIKQIIQPILYQFPTNDEILCENCLNKNLTFDFLEKKVSWLMIVDVCNIIAALNPCHLTHLGGLKNIVASITNYITSPNVKLSKAASDAIFGITRIGNCDAILNEIFSLFDNFSPVSVTRTLSLITRLVERNGIYNILDGFLCLAEEAVQLFDDNLAVLSATFKFAATLRLRDAKMRMKNLFNSAILILSAHTKYFTGQLPQQIQFSSVNEERFNRFLFLIEEEISSQEAEKITFDVAYSAFEFLRTYPDCDCEFGDENGNGIAFWLCDDLIKIFPASVSEYSVRNPGFDALSVFWKGFNYFSTVKDVEIGAIWCRACLESHNSIQGKESSFSQLFSLISSDSVSSMNTDSLENQETRNSEYQNYEKVSLVIENMAEFSFDHPGKVSHSCLNTFALFLMKSPKFRPKLRKFMNSFEDLQHETLMSFLFNADKMSFLETFPDEDEGQYMELDDYTSESDDSSDFSENDESFGDNFTFISVSQEKLLDFSDENEYLLMTRLKFSHFCNITNENISTIIKKVKLSKSTVNTQELLLLLAIFCLRNEFYIKRKFDGICQKIIELDKEHASIFFHLHDSFGLGVHESLSLASFDVMADSILTKEKIKRTDLIKILQTFSKFPSHFFGHKNHVNKGHESKNEKIEIKNEIDQKIQQKLLSLALIAITKAEENLKKLHLALTLFACVVSAFPVVDEITASQFASLFLENVDRLPEDASNRCLRDLASKINESNESRVRAAISSANRKQIEFISPSGVALLSANVRLLPSLENFDSLPYVESLLSPRSVPSFFCRGANFILELVKRAEFSSSSSFLSSQLRTSAQLLLDARKELDDSFLPPSMILTFPVIASTMRTGGVRANGEVNYYFYKVLSFLILTQYENQNESPTSPFVKAVESFLVSHESAEFETQAKFSFFASFIRCFTQQTSGFKKLKHHIINILPLSISSNAREMYSQSLLELKRIENSK